MHARVNTMDNVVGKVEYELIREESVICKRELRVCNLIDLRAIIEEPYAVNHCGVKCNNLMYSRARFGFDRRLNERRKDNRELAHRREEGRNLDARNNFRRDVTLVQGTLRFLLDENVIRCRVHCNDIRIARVVKASHEVCNLRVERIGNLRTVSDSRNVILVLRNLSDNTVVRKCIRCVELRCAIPEVIARSLREVNEHVVVVLLGQILERTVVILHLAREVIIADTRRIATSKCLFPVIALVLRGERLRTIRRSLCRAKANLRVNSLGICRETLLLIPYMRIARCTDTVNLDGESKVTLQIVMENLVVIPNDQHMVFIVNTNRVRCSLNRLTFVCSCDRRTIKYTITHYSHHPFQ